MSGDWSDTDEPSGADLTVAENSAEGHSAERKAKKSKKQAESTSIKRWKKLVIFLALVGIVIGAIAVANLIRIKKQAATHSANNPSDTQISSEEAELQIEKLKNNLDAAYGRFDSVERSSVGVAKVPLPANAIAAVVEFDYQGSGYVSLKADHNGSDYQLLSSSVNAQQHFSGLPMGVYNPGKHLFTNLRVDTNDTYSPWKVKISPVSAAPNAKFPFAGLGNYIAIYEGESRELSLSCDSYLEITSITVEKPNSNVGWCSKETDKIIKIPSGAQLLLFQGIGKWELK